MNILALERKKREASTLHEDLNCHLSKTVAAEYPSSTNRGGTYPPTLPITEGFSSRIGIDWLSFTTQIGFQYVKETIKCLFPGVEFANRASGLSGYPESSLLTVEGVQVGIFCYGADHGKDFVSFSGKGCSMWPVASYPFIRDCLQTISASLKRVDFKFDTYRGEVDHDMVSQAYEAGEFLLKKASKNPERNDISSKKGDVNLGRTINIGRRDSSKMVCCYEKGLEVFSKLDDDFKESCTEPGQVVYDDQSGAPKGTIAEKWFRVEVRYSSKDKDLTLDMITECESYFAGAYPFCARILNLADGLRPACLKPSAIIDLERKLKALKASYGNFFHTLGELGFTADDIKRMVDTGLPDQKLHSSGIVALIKNDPTWRQSYLDSFDVPF